MFDRAGRIVVRNQQYLCMYKLAPQIVKPGCTLRELIKYRKQIGLFTGDPDQYCKQIIESVAAGKISQWTIISFFMCEGAVNNRPPPCRQYLMSSISCEPKV